MKPLKSIEALEQLFDEIYLPKTQPSDIQDVKAVSAGRVKVLPKVILLVVSDQAKLSASENDLLSKMLQAVSLTMADAMVFIRDNESFEKLDTDYPNVPVLSFGVQNPPATDWSWIASPKLNALSKEDKMKLWGRMKEVFTPK